MTHQPEPLSAGSPPRGSAEDAAAWLSTAQAASGFGLWDYDVATGGLRWDAAYLRFFGLTEGDFDGTLAPLLRAVHPEDLQRMVDVIDHVSTHGGPLEVRYRFRRPDGTTGTALAKGYGHVLPDGTVTRLVGIVLDVDELTQLDEERADATRRTAQLVALAQDLNRAHDEQGILDLVLTQGRTRLGADAAVLTLLEQPTTTPPGTGELQSHTSSYYDADVQRQVSVLPHDFPLPMVHTATTGEALFLPDRAAAVQRFPGARDLYEAGPTQGSASVPLRMEEILLGSLSVGYRDVVQWTAEKRAVLETLAELATQAIDRVRSREAEREVASTERRMLAALQRSLLTPPPRVPGVSIEVRYEASAQWAQIGGDWYDAHLGPTGELVLSVGDVTGHDSQAAAVMASVRNLLRATAYLTPGGPAAVLTALDRILHGLHVATLATAVLATISTDPLGRRTLCWSNAGHPPPLLLLPDGHVEVVTPDTHDLLLGCEPHTPRTQRARDLPPGSTLLLYSDGLVERRGEDFDTSVDRLARTFARHGHRAVPDLAEVLLTTLGEETAAEDDLVMLLARTR